MTPSLLESVTVEDWGYLTFEFFVFLFLFFVFVFYFVFFHSPETTTSSIFQHYIVLNRSLKTEMLEALAGQFGLTA